MMATVPKWVERLAMVYPPHFDLARLANTAAERAWTGRGVRIFMWPCGSAMVVRVTSAADTKLLTECLPQLVGTWTRGATLRHVLDDLRWMRAYA